MTHETRNPLGWFIPDQEQLARHTDKEAILRRGQDMLANGQHQSVGSDELGNMIFGHGRLLSAQAVGMKDLWVKIYPGTISDTQREIIRFAENFHRNELSQYMRWIACTKILCGNPTFKQKDLAEALHIGESMAVRLLSPSRTTPAWQEALKQGKVGISDCYQASQLPEEDQAELLKLKLDGASRDTIARAGREKRKRTGEPAAVKLDKVKIAMPGATVAITGTNLDMSQVVELLADTLKQARKAAEQYDVKTWVRMMADQAKTH